jgi:hypothetical protein
MRVTTQTAITQKISRDIQKPVIPDAFATSPPAATPGQPQPDLHALPPSEVRAGDVPEMSTSPGERAINTSTTIAQAAAIAQARAIQITDVRTRCPSRSTR